MKKKIMIAVDDSIHTKNAIRYACNIAASATNVYFTLFHLQPMISQFLLDEAEKDPKSRAELKIWSWDGNTLTLKLSTDWIVGDAVCAWNDGTGDVDNDGVVEIVTVGCMYVGILCDPDLRIWSLPAETNASTSFPYLPIAIAGTATAVLGAAALYLFVRRRR